MCRDIHQAELKRRLESLRVETYLKKATDEKHIEKVQRAYHYAFNRIEDGSARDWDAVKLSFAAFADGFCTGKNTGVHAH